MTDYFKLVEDFFEGQLSPVESANFEKNLETDAELKKVYDEYLDSKDMAGALLQMDILDSIEKAKNSGKSEPKSKTWIFLLLLLALAILLLFWLTSKKEASIYHLSNEQYAELYEEPIWPIVRSSQDTLMQEAMFLFLQKDELEQAKKLILKDDFIDKKIQNYWVAEMYLKQQQLDSVMKYLPTLDSNNLKYERVKYIRSILNIAKKE